MTRNSLELYLLNKIIDTDLGPKIQDPLRASLMMDLNSIGCKYTHRTRKIISIAAVLITKKVLLDSEQKLIN